MTPIRELPVHWVSTEYKILRYLTPPTLSRGPSQCKYYWTGASQCDRAREEHCWLWNRLISPRQATRRLSTGRWQEDDDVTSNGTTLLFHLAFSSQSFSTALVSASEVHAIDLDGFLIKVTIIRKKKIFLARVLWLFFLILWHFKHFLSLIYIFCIKCVNGLLQIFTNWYQYRNIKS